MPVHKTDDSPQPFIAKPADDSFIPSLASVLTHLISLTPATDESKNKITRFHSVIPAKISVDEYLNRIARYFRCSNECFVLSLVYIDRIVKLHSGFTVSILNIHRLLITSVMLAAKFFDDVYYSNSFYARVGGVETDEINIMEAQFLNLINYKLFVSAEEYDQYRQNVEDAVRPNPPIHSLSPSLGLHINSEKPNKNVQQYAVRGVPNARKYPPSVRNVNNIQYFPQKRNGMNRMNNDNYIASQPHINKNVSISKSMIDHQMTAHRVNHDEEPIPNSFFGGNSMCLRMSGEHPPYYAGSYPCDPRHIHSNEESTLIVDHPEERRRDHHNRNGIMYR